MVTRAGRAFKSVTNRPALPQIQRWASVSGRRLRWSPKTMPTSKCTNTLQTIKAPRVGCGALGNCRRWVGLQLDLLDGGDLEGGRLGSSATMWDNKCYPVGGSALTTRSAGVPEAAGLEWSGQCRGSQGFSHSLSDQCYGELGLVCWSEWRCRLFSVWPF
jgi:hypothetical protein